MPCVKVKISTNDKVKSMTIQRTRDKKENYTNLFEQIKKSKIEVHYLVYNNEILVDSDEAFSVVLDEVGKRKESFVLLYNVEEKPEGVRVIEIPKEVTQSVKEEKKEKKENEVKPFVSFCDRCKAVTSEGILSQNEFICNKCFRCKGCGLELNGTNVYFQDGDYFCENCI